MFNKPSNSEQIKGRKSCRENAGVCRQGTWHRTPAHIDSEKCTANRLALFSASLSWRSYFSPVRVPKPAVCAAAAGRPASPSQSCRTIAQPLEIDASDAEVNIARKGHQQQSRNPRPLQVIRSLAQSRLHLGMTLPGIFVVRTTLLARRTSAALAKPF